MEWNSPSECLCQVRLAPLAYCWILFSAVAVPGFRIADALDIHNGKHLAGSKVKNQRLHKHNEIDFKTKALTDGIALYSAKHMLWNNA